MPKCLEPRNECCVSKLYGTVLAIKDEVFWYTACRKCCLEVKNNISCEACGCPLSSLCYRLFLEIDTKLGLQSIAVYGSCLDKYFGKDCNTFTRKFDSFSRSFNDASSCLLKSVEAYFIGTSHLFVLDNDQCSNRAIINKHEEPSRLITETMECIGSQTRSVIFDELFVISKRHVENHFDTDVCSQSFEKVVAPNLGDLCTQQSSHKHNNFPETTSQPELRRSLSDSFAFLQDSLISGLFHTPNLQQRNERHSSSKVLSQSSRPKLTFVRKDQQRLKTHHCSSNQHKQNNSDSQGSFFDTSVLHESDTKSCDAETTCDILDVTLPVLKDSGSAKLKRPAVCSTPPSLIGLPKLRRCHSLTEESRSALNNIENIEISRSSNTRRDISDESSSMLRGLRVDMFDDFSEAEERINFVVHRSEIENERGCGTLPGPSTDKNDFKLISRLAIPIISSTPKLSGKDNTMKKRALLSSLLTGPAASASCMSPDLFGHTHEFSLNKSNVKEQCIDEAITKTLNFDISNDMFL